MMKEGAEEGSAFVLLLVLGIPLSVLACILLFVVLFLLLSYLRRKWGGDWVPRAFPSLCENGVLMEFTCDSLPIDVWTRHSRRFLLFIPQSLCGQLKDPEGLLRNGVPNSVPVVFAFHSPKYTAYSFFKRSAEAEGDTWQAIANQNRFLLIFGEASRRPCVDTPRDIPLWFYDQSDLRYIQHVLRCLKERYPSVHLERVNAAVYSSKSKRDLGALFSSSLSVGSSDIFQSVAHFEGTLLTSTSETCYIPRVYSPQSLRRMLKRAEGKGTHRAPILFIVKAKAGKKIEEGKGEATRCADVISILEGAKWPVIQKHLTSPAREMKNIPSMTSSSLFAEEMWEFFCRPNSRK